MFAKSSLAKALSLAFAFVLLVPLLAGCASASAPVQPATTEAPATMAPATDAPAAPVESAKKTFVFGRYTDAINPDPVMNDANADIWYMQQYYNGLNSL